MSASGSSSSNAKSPSQQLVRLVQTLVPSDSKQISPTFTQDHIQQLEALRSQLNERQITEKRSSLSPNQQPVFDILRAYLTSGAHFPSNIFSPENALLLTILNNLFTAACKFNGEVMRWYKPNPSSYKALGDVRHQLKMQLEATLAKQEPSERHRFIARVAEQPAVYLCRDGSLQSGDINLKSELWEWLLKQEKELEKSNQQPVDPNTNRFGEATPLRDMQAGKLNAASSRLMGSSSSSTTTRQAQPPEANNRKTPGQ